MADNSNFGFGKFVPGFDFLQNVAKGASQALPQMPSLSHWIAPTLNVEELDKRIGELKAVQYWLDQNAKALAATVQALEVQKMTLATLEGMNFNMGDVANAFRMKPAGTPGAAQTTKKPAGSTAAQESHGKPAAGNGVVDPLQWWGALTQQFQQIATHAMKDAAAHAAATTARHTAGEPAKDAARAAPAAPRKSAAKKARSKKAPKAR